MSVTVLPVLVPVLVFVHLYSTYPYSSPSGSVAGDGSHGLVHLVWKVWHAKPGW